MPMAQRLTGKKLLSCIKRIKELKYKSDEVNLID